MSNIIPGLKLIYQTGGVRVPDDPSMPYKLEANFRPPELMQVAFVLMHGGSEEIILRGETRAAIDQFIKMNNLDTHPRLRRLTITGPNGVEHEIPNTTKETKEEQTPQEPPSVLILWNGGWDKYSIDPTQVREMTEAELTKHGTGNSMYFPTFLDDDGKEWIKGKFLDSSANQSVVKVSENQCVLSIEHIAGGE